MLKGDFERVMHTLTISEINKRILNELLPVYAHHQAELEDHSKIVKLN